jgi:hypothetical protein
MVPQLFRASIEVHNDMAYYAGFGLMDHIKHQLGERIGVAAMESVEATKLTGYEKPLTQTREYVAECYILSKAALKTIIQTAVNRSHSGLPPEYF